MLSTLRVVFLPAEREDEGQWCKIINKGGGLIQEIQTKKVKGKLRSEVECVEGGFGWRITAVFRGNRGS